MGEPGQEGPTVWGDFKDALSSLAGGFVWTVVCCTFMGIPVSAVLRDFRPHWKYVSTKGMVTTSEIKTEGTDHSPLIEYTYEVDGRTYTSDRYTTDKHYSGEYGYVDYLVKEHPSGKEVPVYYDPKDPSESLLHLGKPSLGPLRWVLFIQPFFVLGLSILVMGFMRPFRGAQMRRFLAARSSDVEYIPGWGKVKRNVDGTVIIPHTTLTSSLAMGVCTYAFICLAGAALLGLFGSSHPSPISLGVAFGLALLISFMFILRDYLGKPNENRLRLNDMQMAVVLSNSDGVTELRLADVNRWVLRTEIKSTAKPDTDTSNQKFLLELITTRDQRVGVHEFKDDDHKPAARRTAEMLSELTSKPFEETSLSNPLRTGTPKTPPQDTGAAEGSAETPGNMG